MIVTREASQGTVGGGALEMAGIARARAMIEAGEAEAMLAVPLGPRIGQCCGGHVTLSFARATAALLGAEVDAEAMRQGARPAVLVFGAGHTGRALVQALAPLPLAVTLVDTRPETLGDLPAGIFMRAVAVPEAEVARALPGTAYLVVTHDHGLDFLIAAAALERGDAAYVGMIGSRTKREKFRRHLAESGREGMATGLTLPIGRPAGMAIIRDKRPEVIAALTAAEVLSVLLAGAEIRRDGREKRVENHRSPFASGTAQCNSEASERPASKVGNARAS